jgi:predicted RND superfamily exporter protein
MDATGVPLEQGCRAMESLIGAIVRAPRRLACLLVLITIVSAAGLGRLVFDDGFRSGFESDTAAWREFAAERSIFASAENEIAIHLSAPDLGEEKALDAAERFVLELGLLPGAQGVLSVFALRQRPDAAGLSAPLFDAEANDARARRSMLALAAAHPLNEGRLLSADLRHMLVLVRLRQDDLPAVAAAAAGIERTARRAFAGTSVRHAVTGIPVLRVDVLSNIIADQFVVNVLGAAVGFLVCLVMFRGIVLSFIAGMPAVLALVWVLGFLGHSGIGITTLTNALPVLILALAFADSMHLTYETRCRMAAGDEPAVAIAGAIRITAPACAMAALTTGLGFAGLLLSQSPAVRGLGVAGLYALPMTLIAVLAINPVLVRLLSGLAPVRLALSSPAPPLLFPSGAWSRIVAAIVARPLAIALASVLAIVVATILYLRAEPRHSFVESVDPRGAAYRALVEVERRLAPLSSIDVIVPVPPGAPGTIGEAALERLGRVHRALEARFAAKRVLSPWTVARWLEPERPQGAAAAISDLLARTDRALDNAFVAADGSALKLRVLTADIDSPLIRALAAEIGRIAREAVDDGLPPPRIGGMLATAAEVSTIMLDDLNDSFLFAVAASGLAIALWCRSLAIGLLALLPNILPDALAGAWLQLSGNGLEFSSGLALVIAFGIAVDDTLHVLNRLRPRLNAGGLITFADIRRAYREVSPAIVATTVILCAGLVSTQTSALPSIAYFGALSIAVFGLAVLADLVMLPALLSVLVRLQLKASRR